MTTTSPQWLGRDDLDRLLVMLRDDGFRVVGPTVDDGAIVYDDIEGVADLPVGWTDEQAPGRYRLRRRDDEAIFGFVVGPHSWKRELFPARQKLVQIRSGKEGSTYSAAEPEPAPTALIGVRACELAAIDIQDHVFLGGPYRERRYAIRREQTLVIAVNCVEAGDLCFCASMSAGPRVGDGFDLCLTELESGLVAEAGSDAGRQLLERLATNEASHDQLDARDRGIAACELDMGRQLDTDSLPGILFGNLDHNRWQEVGERCIACGNCTQVCPTCFCFDVADVSVVGDAEASREGSWDSCFTLDHSTIHGAVFRPTIADRYRQWMTHKLASWPTQFGTSGCVGCGRCIAWCPVGIDITEEVAAIRSVRTKPAIELPPPAVYEPCPDDPLVPSVGRVQEVIRESDDMVTLLIDRPDGMDDSPGQFNMLSLPAIGDVPISISGSDDEVIEHTIRAVGRATEALCSLGEGDALGIRGPFGSSWPLEAAAGRPVTLIAGGVGLAPLRTTMQRLALAPEIYPSVRLFYGARSPLDILYDAELLGWDSLDHCDVAVTVDRGARGWVGNIGFVTRLVRRYPLPENGIYLICGPEVMMDQVVQLLVDSGIPESHCYLSMERNMKCAAGFCGRCQYGPYFVCKDGPVFRYDQISFLFGQRGF